VKVLSPVTRAQNAPLFPGPIWCRSARFTMGVGSILDCRRCISAWPPARKRRRLVSKAVEGPITRHDFSHRFCSCISECALILDEAAGSKLKESEYYHWVFENQPNGAFPRRGVASPQKNGFQAGHQPGKKTVEAMSDVLE